jgi:hypothetical protein
VKDILSKTTKKVQHAMLQFSMPVLVKDIRSSYKLLNFLETGHE